MALLDIPLLAAAGVVLKVLGTPASFYKDASEYNPTTGTEVKTRTTITTLSDGSALKVSPPVAYSVNLIDGTKIQAGDMRILVAAKNLTFTPDPTYRIVFGSVDFEIITVTPTYAGAVPVLYELQCRK